MTSYNTYSKQYLAPVRTTKTGGGKNRETICNLQRGPVAR